ncbi:DsrE family protein [Parasporobacterium paucivorans]|uniref:Uncharacterized protein n=1 Tax=Parasporobacterium paucivorans DSM 15970 TaxID=1122934 RepID=A0A1M6L9C6_9FIRM|nr:DsrE family protein [Parasporobacterium paucivorans]SHJ67709.1 hypothetical protein SAMN02745691_02355 [Parasporobacterium paucivorans DSM 15970]
MDNSRKLFILWTNADLHTSQYMVMMYATNSMLHNWWDEVTVIIWGSTAKLAAENISIQNSMEMAVHAGVRFSACISCAKQLGVQAKLEDLGIEVIPWGLPLTEILQNNEKLITI